MKNLIKKLLRAVGLYNFVLKLALLWGYRTTVVKKPWFGLRAALWFMFVNRESTNYYYDIANVGELTDWVAACLDVPREEVARYVDELAADNELRERLSVKLATRKDRNGVARFARRIGWYCMARIRKPALTVETGTHDGLGSALMIRAVERNRAEGAAGEFLTFDIDPSAGWLFKSERADWYALVVGDSKQTLPRELDGRTVDMFIHDSDHSYEHEYGELGIIYDKLGEGALILSDNSHCCTALEDFCRERGLDFKYFGEQPLGHVYPGAGIGFAVKR